MSKFLYSAIFTALLVLFSTGFCAAAANYQGTPGTAKIQSVTLKEAILFAFNRDPLINQQVAQLGIGQAQIDEAKSGWMPQISLSGNAGHSQTTDSSGSLNNSAAWGLSVTQLVYDFGKTNGAIGQSTAQRDGYRYRLMATLTDVAEKTALGYVEVKRYSALSEAARENIVALQKVQHMAHLRATAGLSSSSDELQTQTRIDGMRATLEQYEAALKGVKARLAVLTGIDASQFSPLPPALEVKPNSLDDIDYARIPAVMAARAMETSSQFAVERAKSQHLPTLSLKGGRTRYQSDNRAYWDDQIQLSIDAPLYQGGAVSARVRQAEGARSMATSQVDQARFDVLQKASVALADWNGARGRLGIGTRQIANAERTRQVYKNEYTLSKRSINDLLSVEQDVWQARSSKIIAEYDAWSAAVNYASATDGLLPMIGIKKNPADKLPDLNP